MREFKYLTELELLNLAYNSLLDLWLKSSELAEKTNSELDKIRTEIYNDKLNEIRDKIIEVEKLNAERRGA